MKEGGLQLVKSISRVYLSPILDPIISTICIQNVYDYIPVHEKIKCNERGENHIVHSYFYIFIFIALYLFVEPHF